MEMDLKPKSFNVTAEANKNPFLFYGTLYIGSQKTSANFIFDTRSEYSWVPTVDCIESKCASVNSNVNNNLYASTALSHNLYDYTASSTYSQVQ